MVLFQVKHHAHLINSPFNLLYSPCLNNLNKISSVFGSQWCRLGSSCGFFLEIPADKDGYCSNTNWARRFYCEDNSAGFVGLLGHYNYLESCRQLGKVARISS